MATDTPTRVATDLVESAAAEGRRESRSAKQQLDHWARVGRAVSMRQTAARRRIEAVLSGELPLSAVGADERVVATAEQDVRIQERAQVANFGAYLAEEGVTTVALDDKGNLVEYRPDGAQKVLRAAAVS
jgi:hypothetical protein